MHEEPVSLGDLIDSVLCRVIDPQTMVTIAGLRNEMLQQLQDADPNEAAEIRGGYQAKLKSMLETLGPHNCSDC